MDYTNLVLSMKASNVKVMIHANRLLVKKMMDEVSYRRRVNQNVVKITKRIAADTPNTNREST